MNQFVAAVAIGSGGFIGALARYYIADVVRTQVSPSLAFVGTIAVNLLGCLLIGVVTVLDQRRVGLPPLAYRCIIVGVLGSLTTFSTFAIETLGLLQAHRPLAALGNVAVNLIPGLMLVWVGIAVTQMLTESSTH